MGNDISATRQHYRSRHVDDDGTITTARTEQSKTHLSDAVGVLIDTLCGTSVNHSTANANNNVDELSYDDTTLDSYRLNAANSKLDRRRRDRYEDPKRYLKSQQHDTKDISSIHNQEMEPETMVHTVSPPVTDVIKKCYFTKGGIGKTTPHYEGMTLSGKTLYMLPSAMNLKGCPTICDDDLRRVENTYPNQFSRVPDELLLSSGWRRIAKYCSFSKKPIPDGAPFFHSNRCVHPKTLGYYFLLASAIGMMRPCDVEPLTVDLLILLQTDFPHQCDHAPQILIENPDEWVLVDKFCYFSGAPISTENDVHYVAQLDGKPIFMLAFLSPSITAEELYRLNDAQNGFQSVHDVEEVDSIYNLTEIDFHDLRKYHLGRCRELPSNLLTPGAWTKILPERFLQAKEIAISRAVQFEKEVKKAHEYGEYTRQKPNHRELYDATFSSDDAALATIASVTPKSGLYRKKLPFSLGISHNEMHDDPSISHFGQDATEKWHREVNEEGAFDRYHPSDELIHPRTETVRTLSIEREDHPERNEMVMYSGREDPPDQNEMAMYSGLHELTATNVSYAQEDSCDEHESDQGASGYVPCDIDDNSIAHFSHKTGSSVNKEPKAVNSSSATRFSSDEHFSSFGRYSGDEDNDQPQHFTYDVGTSDCDDFGSTNEDSMRDDNDNLADDIDNKENSSTLRDISNADETPSFHEKNVTVFSIAETSNTAEFDQQEASITAPTGDYSPSKAMIEAQELLRKNRQKRLNVKVDLESKEEKDKRDSTSPECTPENMHEESPSLNDKSRRAMILKLARNRIKNYKSANAQYPSPNPVTSPISSPITSPSNTLSYSWTNSDLE